MGFFFLFGPVHYNPTAILEGLPTAGLKRPRISNSNHALRHTAATLGYMHTGDVRAVQEFLGHSDPRQTSRYAHVVGIAKKNPVLFIPVNVGKAG